MRYRQGYYDFDEGGLVIRLAPDFGCMPLRTADVVCSQYTLLIHPDLLLNYPLTKKIRQYGFFSYSANEALHLSEEEKETILSIFKMIDTELNSRIDDFSQDVIVSQVRVIAELRQSFL